MNSINPNNITNSTPTLHRTQSVYITNINQCLLYSKTAGFIGSSETLKYCDCRTESHEQLFVKCELGTADEGEGGGRWNQLLCYP